MVNALSKLRDLMAFLRAGMNHEEANRRLHSLHPSLRFGAAFTVRSPERFSPGPDNYFEHNVYINCGGSWSGHRGFFRSGRNCFIGANTVIYAAGGITFGDNVGIGSGCILASQQQDLTLRSAVYMEKDLLYSPISVGNNVILNVGTVVVRGVTIGDNAIVGAGSVVTRDVPASTVALGAPARVVRTLG